MGEDVAEVGEGARLAAGELVHAAHQLDELARVDVRVAPVLDVRDQRLGDARAVVVDGRRRRVDRLEGLGELLPGGGGKEEEKGQLATPRGAGRVRGGREGGRELGCIVGFCDAHLIG